ncbi:SusC/RagA family TonB-linked outer membrane protein [Membranihabitans maritimus]|uniref:SusC/RagA family TonB-linked outer membrane protein n=1 Tax=Membranihabitans maritimus TaxID=2904244 RepID=UPI001F341ED6|nr:TonB-dependent receptor [Membranihabitans maritimus]
MKIYFSGLPVLYKIMKITVGQFILMTIFSSFSYGGVSEVQVLDQEVSVKWDSISIENALVMLESQANVKFVYSESKLQLQKKVNYLGEKKKLGEVLDRILLPNSIVYVVKNNNYIILKKRQKGVAPKLYRSSQLIKFPRLETTEIAVSGTIVDKEEGQPLIGVNVLVKGTEKGTTTDLDGNFRLENVKENATLTLSYIGYRTQEVNINGRSNLNITMEEDAQTLDEVVVVAFGSQKKKTVTGAVSSIETKELLQSSQANISNAMVGRMPGLLTKQTSGEPGFDQAEIRIRGASTFTGSLSPLILIDGVESDNFNNLDPNSIENITILKDASATAVYGVRGANGVILITTKRGEIGAPQISYTVDATVTKFIDIRQNMNSFDHATTINKTLQYDSYFRGGYNPPYSDFDIALYETGQDPVFYPDMDWHNELLKPFTTQMQHNLNIQGGTERVKYFASVGYFDQGGLLNNTNAIDLFDAQINYRRYNFRSNLDFKVTNDLTVSVDLSTTNENRRGKGAGSSIPSLMLAINNASPSGTPGVVDGKLIDIGVPRTINPYSSLFNYGYAREYRNYLKGRVKVTQLLDFVTEGLSIHGVLSHQSFNSQQNTISKALNIYLAVKDRAENTIFVPQRVDAPFNTGQSFGKNRMLYAELGLNYARDFGDHSITGLLLYNQSKRHDPNLAFLVPSGYQGAVGRVTYNYQGKYLAEFNAGFNGTENFAEGKRFGFFPAYSVGWVLSEESFFPDNDIISFLKIRASYGEVGNDKIGGERFLYRPSAYEYSGGYYFGEVGSNYNYYPASQESKIGNPDLTWERAVKRDIGIEMTLWEDKLRVNVDYFDEKRNNILADISTVPSIVGADLPAYNLGRMQNRGIDGEITFNDRIGDVSYWLKGIYTFARNKILFQDEVPNQYPYQDKTGQMLGQYFGLIADGVYNTWEEVNEARRPGSDMNFLQPGDLKYRDVNGDGLINGYDYVPIGYSNFPGKIFGFSLGGEFKGFDLSILFQGAADVSYRYYSSAIKVLSQERSIPQYLDKSWTQERFESGGEILFPRLSLDNRNYTTSSFLIVDASYLRLKNAEIGYRFSNKLFERLNIESGRVFINGDNLLTWSGLLPGIDPEQGASSGDTEPYPMTQNFNLGVNIKF